MDLISGLIKNIGSYWYIVIPEILYALFAGFFFFGPGGALGVLLYLLALYFFPKPVMAVAGVIMAAHFVLTFGKGLIGDRIADSKKPDESEEYKGVPKLSGDSSDIQEALDKIGKSRKD